MDKKCKYKRATLKDIEELVRTRIIVLRATNRLSDDVDMSVVEQESYAYYKRALQTGEHIAYQEYKDILVRVIDNKELPIVYNINFGHATPRCALQYGVCVTVDMKQKKIVLDM